jgi:hypothetical protein
MAEHTFGQTPAKKDRAPEATQMTAKVVRVIELAQGLIVSLDNDQTWIEKQAEGFFPLKVGDTVTVKTGLLGSFWMSSSSTGNRTIQVQRTK